MKTYMVCGFLILSILGVHPGNTTAQIICVPDDYGTIQEAILNASQGDTVQIADGVYTGIGNRDVDLLGKQITVTGASNAEACVIDCQSAGRGFYVHSGEQSNTIIQNVTIRNGFKMGEWPESAGGGILCDSASPTIRNCIFHFNTARTGGGVHCNTGSEAIIDNCVMAHNFCGYDGGGINCYAASPRITNCVIDSNTVCYDGGGINCLRSYPLIQNVTFTGNSGDWGGGLYCWEASPVVVNCSFSGNSSRTGGGICPDDFSNPTISSCTVMNNSAYWGGGVYVDFHSAPVITDTVIASNNAYIDGGGIYCLWSDPSLSNCLIYGNSGQTGGGGFLSYCSPRLQNCTFSLNHALTGAGLVIREAAPLISDSILWGDFPDELSILGQSVPSISFSCVYSDSGAYPGTGNINADPCFVAGNFGSFYLSHTAAGQPVDSPCINAGSDMASLICFSVQSGELCLNQLTTRTDAVPDSGRADIGYHYAASLSETPTPVSTPSPVTESPSPVSSATPSASQTPTPPHTPTSAATHTTLPTLTPSPFPTITPYASPQPVFLSVELEMPAHHFSAGAECWLRAHLACAGSTCDQQYPFVVMLDLSANTYWFYPSWHEYPPELDWELLVMHEGSLEKDIISPFIWPETSAMPWNDAYFVSAFLSQDATTLISSVNVWDFSWN